MFEWAYSGANKAVPRNVGPECAYFLSRQRQIIETIIVTTICVYILSTTIPKLQIPDDTNYIKSDRGGKRLLVILLALLWGMEIGFKFASRTVIYLLNPCHVTTLIQIYLLSAPPSKTVTALFRIHLNLLNGPLLAFLFPETASRTVIFFCLLVATGRISQLMSLTLSFINRFKYLKEYAPRLVPYLFQPDLMMGSMRNRRNSSNLAISMFSEIFAEAALYWIQHGMMFVIPYYLLRLGGVYNVEPWWDLSWSISSYCLNLLYHFIVLQIIAIPAQVNLNHMLCPAILDPFDGAWYRIAAVLHQALLCPLLCKIFCLVSEFCLTKFPPTKVKPQLKDHLHDKITKEKNIENNLDKEIKHID